MKYLGNDHGHESPAQVHGLKPKLGDLDEACYVGDLLERGPSFVRNLGFHGTGLQDPGPVRDGMFDDLPRMKEPVVRVLRGPVNLMKGAACSYRLHGN